MPVDIGDISADGFVRRDYRRREWPEFIAHPGKSRLATMDWLLTPLGDSQYRSMPGGFQV
ncbi:hypothetical protein VX037_08445 [Gordonia sp. Z-3]|jgi:hypothetical protein|uniref:hypothetical protein n=1 Tax=Gordonia TaxID=2053 RepID=UPI001F21E226|nr:MULTISPECIES: hypothetical protein [Gordonia]MED5801050.1 hypothetical protein [Gordonia sp. Z-3]